MTTIHCYAKCPNRDSTTDQCRKTDIVVNEAGCIIHGSGDKLTAADIEKIKKMSIEVAQMAGTTQKSIYYVAEMLAEAMAKAGTNASEITRGRMA